MFAELDFNRAGQSGDCLDVATQRVLAIPLEQRDWRVVLAESNLRSSILWTGVEAIQRGTPFPSLKQTWDVLLSRYCNHIIFGESRLNPLTVGEFALAESLMKKLTVASASESIARRRGKRKRESLVRADVRVEDVLATPPSRQPPSHQPSSGVGLSQAAVVDEEAGTITITIPATASTYSDATSMSKLADSFLFPADEACLNQMGAVAAADWGVSRAVQVWQCLFIFPVFDFLLIAQFCCAGSH